MAILDQSQIHSVYISLIIDGVQYGTVGTSEDAWSPQAITHLEVKKTTSGDRGAAAAGFQFTVELNYLTIPDFYERILKAIKLYAGGMIPATIQYGYVGEDLSSPLYNLVLIECQPNDLWTSLTLKFIESDSVNQYNIFTEATNEALAKNEYTNLSDIVTAIANGQGWKIGQIAETIPYSEPIKIKNKLKSPIDAINELLQRYPNETKEGEGAFVCGFKHTIEGSFFYFVPTFAVKNRYGFTNTEKSYEFYFNALPQGNVISFTPKFVSAIGDEAGQESNKDNKLDPNKLMFETRPDLGLVTTDSREMISIIYNMENRPPVESLSEPESYNGFVNPEQKVYNIESPNIKQYMQSTIKGKISQYVNVVGIRNTASMEVLGDPGLNVMDYINVIPMYPQDGYVNPGKIHPSGGVYWIKSITDVIDLGKYTSTLELAAESQQDFQVGEITAARLDAINAAAKVAALEKKKEGE